MANVLPIYQPTRLELARRAKGISKIELAERTGIDRRTLSNYFAGEREPAGDILDRLTEVLEIDAAFLVGSAVNLTEGGAVSFRSLARMSASIRDQARAQADLAWMLNDWIEQQFELPESRLPDLRGESTPEAASVELRRMWALGEGPIGNIVRLFESKGIRVYSLLVESTDLDAISMWKGSTPFVLLNSQKSAERNRFDAAHELGHLVLHRHALTKSKDQEREADQFASAFLMPSQAINASVPGLPKLNDLIRVKRTWRVSVAALAYRLNQIGHLNEWHYRMIASEIGKKSYRTSEPEPTHYDESKLLPSLLGLLRDEGVSRSHIAEKLGLRPATLDRLLRGLMVTTLSRNDDEITTTNSSKSERPHLVVIDGGGARSTRT